ncbi:N-acetylmuramoyl-L-alanine amidase-like domain-containing protein [Rickettsiella endosymbiont of Aleochara curtula]|uniref:N-acetylmuramoyl-L-alanine amidase-like domain-containing protein n=1 Tax=Rickettsiella endosymbiont of Aleochara curtula TaxID=3077936 RepID=UPI00313D3C7B
MFIPLSFAGTQSDEIVKQLISLNQNYPIQRRIEIQSAALLNTPYLEGALGEGVNGRYDQNPLYRFDYFDCETYVDTVMALALAKNLPDFKNKINQIRYKQGNVSFTQRNHFPSADWIPNNKRNGYIRELSYLIAGQEARLTRTKINLRNWYRNLTIDRIQIPYLNPQEKQTLLFQLKKEGGVYGSKNVSVSYVPVFELLQSPRLRQRIPTGSLIFFVGHDSYLSSRIGTSMNVLHMSFAIWNNGQLYCRMASSKAGKVLDVLFPDYLKTYLSLGTLDGISVWSITEQT